VAALIFVALIEKRQLGYDFSFAQMNNSAVVADHCRPLPSSGSCRPLEAGNLAKKIELLQQVAACL